MFYSIISNFPKNKITTNIKQSINLKFYIYYSLNINKLLLLKLV